MVPRARFPFLVTLLLAQAALVQAVGAQTPARERVQMELDVTDRRIEQAEVIVSNSDDTHARAEVATSVGVQGRAKSAFGSSELVLAVRLTLEARGHADRAIALVRGLPDPDRVRAQIERSREMLDRARERIEECDQDRARAAMATALAMQGRAEDAGAAGRYLAALQLTMSARERGLRALRLCNLEENRFEAADRALRRTDDLIGRAQERLADRGNEAAHAALARAQQIEAQAWGEFRAERPDAALRLTQAARALAYRALRLAAA